jgi:exodeoxyribonuclease-1
MGFVFYDTETTGLNAAFDQIVHLAAIRTDDNLRPIERLDAKSRLMPHILPSPEALCVTGVGIDELCSTARPSFLEMMCAVQKTLLSWSPSTFIGYNSIRFDEAFLRHGLYQTLHPAYLTSKHGNARGDALRLARAVHALQPDALVAASGANGSKGFRLGGICTANGFQPDIRHDAMADVEALLWLCQLIAERAPDVWSQFLRFTNKVSARSFLEEEDAVILIDPRRDDPGLRVLTWLGASAKDANLHYCVDLASDVMSLRSFEPDALVAAVSAQGGPIRRVRINASPMMLPLYELENLKELSAEAVYLEQAVNLRGDPSFIARLLSAVTAAEPVYPVSPHVEDQLYDRLATYEDEEVMAAFHAAEWSGRPTIVREFADERFIRLGRRQIFFERPDLLDDRTRVSMRAAIGARHLSGQGGATPWTTIRGAQSRIEKMLEASADGLPLLARYQAYLDVYRQSAEQMLNSQGP